MPNNERIKVPAHSRRSPKSTQWATEASFAVDFVNWIASSAFLPRSAGASPVVLQEVDGLHGRVDVMAASVSVGSSFAPELARLMRRPCVARIVLALHAKQPKTAARLAQDVDMTVGTVTRWLGGMLHAQLVAAVGTGGFVLGPAYRIPRAEIWSFELKLRDWRRALYQATRYRAFSQRSFVVMPSDQDGPARRQKDRFRLAGVGLASFDPVRGIRVHVSPRRITPRSSYLHTLAAAEALVVGA